MKERFEQQLKEFIEQLVLAKRNVDRLEAVAFYIQQELDNLQAQETEAQDGSSKSQVGQTD